MPTAAKSDAEVLETPERPSLVSSHKPKRGRPPTLSDEKKRKRRNVSISDEAWEKLEKLASEFGCTSKSELLEKIGQGDVDISTPKGQTSRSSLSEILIYRRLLGLFVPHSDALRSVVGFNYAVYQKLPALKVKPFAELVINNVLTAMSVVFQHCYIRPDRYINSTSALNRLIGYCLLLNQADLGTAWEFNSDEVTGGNNLIDHGSAKACLDQIQRAMSHLKAASFSHQLTALRLKYIGGFTETQIQQIYELQGMSFTIEQIRCLVHEGWASFRSHWSQTTEIDSPKDLVEVPLAAEHYCNLLWSSSLESAKNRKALLKIILAATYDAPLNFWLCEIEHKWSIEFLGKDAGLDKEFEQLQAEIQVSMDKQFQDRKLVIDKHMHYCLDHNAAVEKLADLFEEETQISRKTQLGDFMIRLLQAKAEERFALQLMNVLK